jgi:hypothetical protein
MKIMRDEPAAYPRCPHCEERPAAGHHLCPLNLEADGCECCGPCARLCSDIRAHIVAHTPAVFVDYGAGEMEITYIEGPETADEADAGDEGYGLSA